MMESVTEDIGMKTYVAEINGEAILAFRAEDDSDAYAIVNEENGGLQLGLNGYSGLRHADGRVLWDDEAEIKARLATDDEHDRWLKARDAETGSACDGKQFDPDFPDDPDDFMAYLISVKPVDEDEEEDEGKVALMRRLMGTETGYSPSRLSQMRGNGEGVIDGAANA
jgi:hypothetical protein